MSRGGWQKNRPRKHPELGSTKTQEYYNRYARMWRTTNAKHRLEYDRWAGLKKRYGLSREQFEIMYEAQNGKCAICKLLLSLEPRRGKDKTCVDHSHKTNRVRGLLCPNCNAMIGMAHEQVEVLDAAIQYLRRYEDNETLIRI